ncbi:hypothetical protein WOB59_14560 [Methylocystis sp. IM4]|uniref:hypothetical protein n=1 Tax=Methylocystis sp. IM4 TaxID=3136560 RepID=UPI0031191732
MVRLHKRIVGVLSLALAFSTAAGAERVGNVGAVNPAAFGAPPGAVRRALSLGQGVEKGERIDTAGEGARRSSSTIPRR